VLGGHGEANSPVLTWTCTDLGSTHCVPIIFVLRPLQTHALVDSCGRLATVGGHLFIMNGDVSRLSCDAWLLPTDDDFRISRSFAQSVGAQPDSCLADFEWSTGQRVQPLHENVHGEPWIWLGLVGRVGEPPTWYAQCGAEFIERATASIRTNGAVLDRRPLLGVNLVGTGEGGMASDKGNIHQVLIPELAKAAHKLDTDVVLVTWGRRAYAAAQWARNDYLEHELGGDRSQLWGLGDQSSWLTTAAHDLAEQVRQNNLVLFIGAGVSAGAGFPIWQTLLDELAIKAGFEQGDLSQLQKLDMRDQAALLSKRLLAKGQYLGEMISDRFSATQYSLTHGLLASLGVRENVTTNYDLLFEAAVEANQERLAVLPYQAVQPAERWLLKLHGSIDHENDIVLTRADYLGVPSQRGALFGLVQAMLLTRHMLFIGYSLSDEDFHAVMNDVSTARSGMRDAPKIGTAMTLFDDPIFNELWSSELDVIAVSSVTGKPSPVDTAAAARQLQIFLDLVCFNAADLSAYLLDDSYSAMLSKDENDLRDRLLELKEMRSAGAQGSGWERIARLLDEFAGGLYQHRRG
jgi:hypothetical protein